MCACTGSAWYPFRDVWPRRRNATWHTNWWSLKLFSCCSLSKLEDAKIYSVSHISGCRTHQLTPVYSHLPDDDTISASLLSDMAVPHDRDGSARAATCKLVSQPARSYHSVKFCHPHSNMRNLLSSVSRTLNILIGEAKVTTSSLRTIELHDRTCDKAVVSC